jgi:alkanesulfonate monooxygenase SsuD/methylene tetrahydromethanopterin reductase-like flavin-dependent oxidoreductase (luciferase family)
MEFGIFLTMPSPDARPSKEVYDFGMELILKAEELGFGRAWLAEHHFTNYSYISRPFLVLANAAARTKRIRLGTAIIPLPLHYPLLVAEEVAALDVLSNGRVDFGIGKGYQKYQFERLGAKKDNDLESFTECAQLICQALQGKCFSFHGRHFQLPETLIFLRASLSHEFPELAKSRHIGTQRPVFVSNDQNDIVEAIEAVRWNARVSISQRYDFGRVECGQAVAEPLEGEPTPEEIVRDYAVFGTPRQCVGQIQRLEEGLGCSSASFWFGSLNFKKIRLSMELFSREVMPAFQ